LFDKTTIIKLIKKKLYSRKLDEREHFSYFVLFQSMHNFTVLGARARLMEFWDKEMEKVVSELPQ
jgi:hypothetical protein